MNRAYTYEFYSFNTAFQIRKEEQTGVLHKGNNRYIREIAQTATSMTHEYLTEKLLMHPLYYSKQICLSKPAILLMGSNPHPIKRHQYID